MSRRMFVGVLPILLFAFAAAPVVAEEAGDPAQGRLRGRRQVEAVTRCVPLSFPVPDLAVEVLSEGNTPEEMSRKLHDYFDTGVRLVWYFDPRRKTSDPNGFRTGRAHLRLRRA